MNSIARRALFRTAEQLPAIGFLAEKPLLAYRAWPNFPTGGIGFARGLARRIPALNADASASASFLCAEHVRQLEGVVVSLPVGVE